jgi:cell division protein YceG involved in septum cleavage
VSRGDRSRLARERTPEERERDRQERERRRVGRSGEASSDPPPTPEHADPHAPEHPAAEPQAHAREVARPPSAESSARARDVAGSPSAESPARGRDVAGPPSAESPARGRDVAEPPSTEPAAADSPDLLAGPHITDPSTGGPATGAASEPPLPPPVSVPPPLPAAEGAPPPAPGTPGAQRRAGSRRSWLARVVAVIALLAVVAAVFLLFRSLFSSSHHELPPPPAVVRVVIPEGKTRAQIALIASASGLSGSYRAASRRSPLLNPLHYGAPRGTSTLEGFLFPATYDTNRGEPARRLVEDQLIAFKENFGAAAISRAHALHETPYELLTVASMVEREAEIPSDRAKIAAVIYNRLREGMPLGIDASIYYAVEQRAGIATYTRELTETQLHIDSPYNTRTHTGLPPTPISNPGVASIEAAAHPAHVDYLYYVAGADGCGEQVFSTTLAAFEAHAAAYHAAVKANGGQPPPCKHK